MMVSDYRSTGFGQTCSSKKLVSIIDEDECKAAVKLLGNPYSGKEDNGSYPTGCYLHKENGYFNKQISGIGNENTRSMCKGNSPLIIISLISSHMYCNVFSITIKLSCSDII